MANSARQLVNGRRNAARTWMIKQGMCPVCYNDREIKMGDGKIPCPQCG